MFSLMIAFLIYLIQVGYSHLTWNAALGIAAKFLFYWNFIFASLTIFFFSLMLLGLSTILLKVPFIGVGIYRFNEKIRQTGIIRFLLKTSVLWLLSRLFILIGSYFLAFGMLDRNDLIGASTALVFIGYLIKKQSSRQNKSTIRHHFSVTTFEQGTRSEKDITPTDPLPVREPRNLN